ncbi:hypothetical protein TSTA_034520 [Talaromyces stipitatus ATCC 10500]|uniref:Uncharacterized protein n=1 Tax=Talaromyces stipitatus (strain ATCC 10500 / CBS 375.48 / QM 6759 / NRRL 1006) TaxID=441959 RepID=B8M6Z4_TALSN|nr:uncharacterized protein TSTA_034520 [Talaromyces stipitatus ATCC 10500]EED20214.1 hypothetical protein TSTA_034520 [Talaromyces stipitatus ATCC 10500]
MATLSAGGNDIDFKGILFNCILETTEFGGTPTKPCDQQRQDTHTILQSPDLINKADHLIKKIDTKVFNEDDPGGVVLIWNVDVAPGREIPTEA